MIETVLSTVGNVSSSYAGKTLAERVAGRFYTPDVIGSDLARWTLDLIEARILRGWATRSIRACDPFCGDGRLAIALLAEASSRPLLRRLQWRVTVQDVEIAAAQSAATAVQNAANAFGLRVQIRTVARDSFRQHVSERYDVVITNPPWELLKPDVRELAHLNPRQQERYRQELKALCSDLEQRFPDARPDKAWAGWGTNLARCGWDLALRCCAPGGALGIVLPSTLFGDQASTTMRRSAFRRSRLIHLAAYPPEARLFARVDQPVIASCFAVEKSDGGVDATLHRYASDRVVKSSDRIRLTEPEFERADYTLPITYDASMCALLAKLSDHPRLVDMEGTGLWLGRELDETRISDKLVPGRQHPFIKGRMIRRHGIVEMPSLSVRAELVTRFRSIAFPRCVWRDVSRSSQSRRMIGAVIPPGWVAGNSLHVAHFHGTDLARLHALHGILSSFVFEAQVRLRLTTGHMSLGIVRRAHLPDLTSSVINAVYSAVSKALKSDGAATLEVAVARAYGLGREDMAELLSRFPKIESTEREAILAERLWRSRKRQ
jgi:Alw26I/Eco31I/Esp3I family type II restriction m6 adenine DNA methyltransferase